MASFPSARTTSGIPHLTELAEKYKGKVTFSGICVWDSTDRAAKKPYTEADYTKHVTDFVTEQGDKMVYNVGLDDANLSKLELCAVIQKHLPKFVYVEAPIGEDPDKRDYIVSNARIAGTGFKPEWGLDRGIVELMKGFTILRNTIYSNV